MSGNITPLRAAGKVARASADRRNLPGDTQSAGGRDPRAGHFASGGFVYDFPTADDHRVMVAAFTRCQFADLAKAARLASTFAFVERLLHADFSDRADLYTHRNTIATLLTSWFARRTVADLATAFGGTSVLWASFVPGRSLSPGPLTRP